MIPILIILGLALIFSSYLGQLYWRKWKSTERLYNIEKAFDKESWKKLQGEYGFYRNEYHRINKEHIDALGQIRELQRVYADLLDTYKTARKQMQSRLEKFDLENINPQNFGFLQAVEKEYFSKKKPIIKKKLKSSVVKKKRHSSSHGR